MYKSNYTYTVLILLPLMDKPLMLSLLPWIKVYPKPE